MKIHIDAPALHNFYFLCVARQRTYYLAEPPLLGILVIRSGQRIEELVGLVVDAALGYEPGVERWCAPGYAGRNHGKMTIYQEVADAPPELTMSEVLVEWRKHYVMR